MPAFSHDVTFVVRTRAGAAAILPAVKAAVYGAEGGQPVYSIHTMRELASESMAAQRFPMVLLAAFAVLALVLASVGIHGGPRIR